MMVTGGGGIFKNLKRPRRVVRNLLIFGFRGTENFLVYLWIIKDLAWTQTWYYTAFTFGFLSILAQLILVFRSIHDWNFEDIWHQLGNVNIFLFIYIFFLSLSISLYIYILYLSIPYTFFLFFSLIFFHFLIYNSY